MSTHNLCFEQKYKKYQSYLSENFYFLEVKFSIYLNRSVFVINHRCSKRPENSWHHTAYIRIYRLTWAITIPVCSEDLFSHGVSYIFGVHIRITSPFFFFYLPIHFVLYSSTSL